MKIFKIQRSTRATLALIKKYGEASFAFIILKLPTRAILALIKFKKNMAKPLLVKLLLL